MSSLRSTRRSPRAPGSRSDGPVAALFTVVFNDGERLFLVDLEAVPYRLGRVVTPGLNRKAFDVADSFFFGRLLTTLYSWPFLQDR